MTPRHIVFDAILFDAVGTLIDPEPPVADVYYQAARRHGSRRTRDEIGARVRAAFAGPVYAAASGSGASGSPLARPPTSASGERSRWRRVVAAVVDDVGERSGALFEELWQHFALPASWRVHDDVEPAWELLERSGYRLGIASNFDQRLEAIVAGLPPLDRGQHVFHSAGLGFSKPDVRFFRSIERRLAARPSELLLVGDDPLCDLEGARAAGWHALLVRRSRPPAADLRQLAQIVSAAT